MCHHSFCTTPPMGSRSSCWAQYAHCDMNTIQRVNTWQRHASRLSQRTLPSWTWRMAFSRSVTSVARTIEPGQAATCAGQSRSAACRATRDASMSLSHGRQQRSPVRHQRFASSNESFVRSYMGTIAAFELLSSRERPLTLRPLSCLSLVLSLRAFAANRLHDWSVTLTATVSGLEEVVPRAENS